MSLRVSVSGQPHRCLYHAGDTVKVLVHVHTCERPPVEKGILTPHLPPPLIAEGGDGSAKALPVLELVSLKAQLVGDVRVDSSRVDAQLLAQAQGHNASLELIAPPIESSEKSSNTATITLYGSPLQHVVPADAKSSLRTMRSTDRRSYYVSFRLPPHIPPSYRGPCVRFHHTVIVTLEARTLSGTTLSRPPVLRLPLKVVNPSLLSQTRILTSPVVEASFQYGGQSLALPEVATPSIASPTSDELFAIQEATNDRAASSARKAAGSESSLSGWYPPQSLNSGAPATVCAVFSGCHVMTAMLASPFVSAGDAARVSLFTPHPLQRGEWTAVRATISFFIDEMLPVKWLRSQTQVPKNQIYEKEGVVYCVVGRQVLWESEHVIAWAEEVAEEIPVPPLRMAAHGFTSDIVRAQHGIAVTCQLARTKQLTSNRNWTELPCPEQVEVVIPVHVVGMTGEVSQRMGSVVVAGGSE